jgi:mannose/fructose/N-acetylgalactosamine-specific phosphotransferase system component IID
MNLPNLSNVEIPKRIAAAIACAWLIKDIKDLNMAMIVAGIVVVGIISQTITDVKGKKQKSE